MRYRLMTLLYFIMKQTVLKLCWVYYALFIRLQNKSHSSRSGHQPRVELCGIKLQSVYCEQHGNINHDKIFIN